MGKLRVHNIEAQTGTNVDLGAAGDVVTLASDSLQTNLYKDSGANTIFQSDGAGTLSNVNSVLVGNGPKLITSSPGTGVTSIDFTSGIDSTYDKYMFVILNLNPAVTEMFTVNFSSDSFSSWATKTTTSPRAYHYENDSSAGLSYWTAGDLAQSTSAQFLGEHTFADADASLSGILYLYSPSSTTYVKQFMFRTNNMTNAGVPISMDMLGSGYCNTTSAINSVRFALAGGGAFDGTVKMYGIS